MWYEKYFYDYYQTPSEYETFHEVHSKNLSQEEEQSIQNEIRIHFETQEKDQNIKRQQIIDKIKNTFYPYRKKFICSQWVRGFCFFQTKDCVHAHGVSDLIYDKDDDFLDAQTNYYKIDIKSLTNNLNYLHLYEFCKLYNLPDVQQITLDEINNDKTIRITIREHTRTKLFEEFFLMLRKLYPNIFLTEQFLVSQFTRIGVGSDNLGFSIKPGRISSYLMKHLCYLARLYHPPQNIQNCSYSTYMIVRDKRLNIQQYLKSKVLEVLQDLKKANMPFIEQSIRQLVKDSQQSEVEPSFEVYLVKDNMCLFRYFKNWITQDEDFFKQCLQIFEPNEQCPNFIMDQITFDCCSEQSEKTTRKNKLIEEYLEKKYKNQKRKFCRYWLHGLCIFNKDQCQYSHGAEDLIYEAYDENIDDPEYTDSMSQRPLWYERSYVSLFREQDILLQKGLIESIHTLNDLDDKKELRESIREKMQLNAMEEFMELIWKYYGKNIIFTESFIIREFKRVGFFKIGYTLKNQMIIDFISQKKCFVSQSILPPLLQKQSLIYAFPDYIKIIKHFIPKVFKVFQDSYQEQNPCEKKTSDSDKRDTLNNDEENNKNNIIVNYKNSDQENLKNNNEIHQKIEQNRNELMDETGDSNEPLFTVNEYLIKKEFYKDPQLNIPPLHLIQKHYNKSLSEIINNIFDDTEFQQLLIDNIPQFKLNTLKNCLLLDSDTEKVQNLISKLLQNKSHKILLNFDKFFFKVYQEFRPQIRATIGMVKFKENFKHIMIEKYNFDIFNMSSKSLLLQKKALKSQVKQNGMKQNNKVIMKKEDQQYQDQILQDKYIFKDANLNIRERIILIETKEQIENALQIIQQQSQIGVDLEGNLSKHGHIDLIQISYYNYNENHSIIYVFDFLVIEKQQDLFEIGKNAIRDIIQNKQIIKVMQGCQKDAIALYHLFNTKVVSGIDTQLAHNFICQAKKILSNKNSKKPIIDHEYFNCGLNSILKLYEAPNGLNPLKNQFQNIFADPQQAFFYMNTRPINEEFLIYSSKDVEDLIPVYFNILKQASQNLKLLYEITDISLVNDILIRVSQVSTLYKGK